MERLEHLKELRELILRSIERKKITIEAIKDFIEKERDNFLDDPEAKRRMMSFLDSTDRSITIEMNAINRVDKEIAGYGDGV